MERYIFLVLAAVALFAAGTSGTELVSHFYGFGENYIIPGRVKTQSYVSPFALSPPTTEYGVLVLDAINNRMFLDMGSSQYWILKNETFVTMQGVPQLVNRCGVQPNFNYATMVKNYANAFSVEENSTFIGQVWDVGSCNFPITVEMVMEQMRVRTEHQRDSSVQVIKMWNFLQGFPTNEDGLNICVWIAGYFEFNVEDVDFFSDRSSYFILPRICDDENTRTDYCSAVYYPGQACSPYIY